MTGSGAALDRFALTGRTVLVAGAGGGGIGTAVCRAVAQLGGNVVGVDKDEDALAVGAAAVEGTGPFLGVLADVGRLEEVERAVAEGAEAFGFVDGLVHVVGGQRREHWHPAEGYPPSTLDEVLDLNVRSALLTSRAVAEPLIRTGRRGSLVHVSSVAALFASPNSLAYGVAKAGLSSMTRTMALEWGRHGIRVNGVAAGTIRTPHSRGNDAADAERDVVLPLKRRGEPDELAAAITFLLSDAAGFVTGQTLAVDGGSSIRPSYLDPDDIPVFVEDEELRRQVLGR